MDLGDINFDASLTECEGGWLVILPSETVDEDGKPAYCQKIHVFTELATALEALARQLKWLKSFRSQVQMGIDGDDFEGSPGVPVVPPKLSNSNL